MRRIFHRACRDERGFTMIEVMVAATLLLVGVLGTVQLINVANEKTVTDQKREAGTNLARELVEAAHEVPYTQLTPGGVAAALQAVPNLASSGGTWEIERRGVTFTVTATACTVDDKVDGYRAPAAAGTFCAESSQTDSAVATQDRNGDDFRRVSATVSWQHAGRTRSVRQTTIVNNPGDSAGPAVTSLTSSVWSPVTQSSVTSIVFTAEVTAPPKTSETTKVRISIDGAFRGNATQVGSEWRWTWSGVDLLPDKTYVITAQAYDADGRSRGARILRMVLNRNPATAPSALVLGRNVRLADHVDLRWTSTNEPDVTGYRVYRNTSPSTAGAVKVCETSLEGLGFGGALWKGYVRTKDPLSCVDTSAPASGTLYYGVTALDADPLTGAVREQQTFDVKALPAPNGQPAAPVNLDGTAVNNTVTLTWTAPAGVTVDHYRIYRDGTTVDARYDRTGGAQTTWTDNQLGGTAHDYRIVAVSAPTSTTKWAESPIVGPITRGP